MTKYHNSSHHRSSYITLKPYTFRFTLLRYSVQVPPTTVPVLRLLWVLLFRPNVELKIQLPLLTTRRHAEGAAVHLHSFVTSALIKLGLQLHCVGAVVLDVSDKT